MTAPDAATRPTWGHRSGPDARVRRWQPYRNSVGTMCGMIINGCKLMVGPNGKHWIATPSEKATNKDGSPRLDANGKQVWIQHVDFVDKTARDRFGELVLAALRREHPGAVDGAP